MGPQHPSTHGVLRLIPRTRRGDRHPGAFRDRLPHTGIEKNLEFRTWTQGVTFVTRMDYLAPIFNETALLPRRRETAGHHRSDPRARHGHPVMLMELNRISSHLVCLATGGMELGALTAMTFGFREREHVLDVLESVTGLRMNHAFIRPGGLAQDIPEDAPQQITDLLALLRKRLPDTANLLVNNSIWMSRTEGVGTST